MQYIKPKVSTLVVGQAASMGSLLLAAGEKGMRFSLPNSRIMVHQPSGGFQGQATDISIHAREILELKERLNKIYVHHTGQTLKKVEDALERGQFHDRRDGQGLGPDRRDRHIAGRYRRGIMQPGANMRDSAVLHCPCRPTNLGFVTRRSDNDPSDKLSYRHDRRGE